MGNFVNVPLMMRLLKVLFLHVTTPFCTFLIVISANVVYTVNTNLYCKCDHVRICGEMKDLL